MPTVFTAPVLGLCRSSIATGTFGMSKSRRMQFSRYCVYEAGNPARRLTKAAKRTGFVETCTR